MKLIVLYSLFFLTFSSQLLAQQRFIIEIDGHERIYYLYLPQDLDEDAPLVFVLHGYGGSAEGIIEYSGMNNIADQNQFAICYPQGYLGNDNKNSWNAGYSNDDIDDVKYLSTLARFLQHKYSLSPRNTFCTGMSNGADMSYFMACHSPGTFCAIAPVAGCMMETTFKSCSNPLPIPVFEIHGTDDEITLWEGDPNYSDKYGGYLGTEEIIKFWAQQNNGKQVSIDTLINRNVNDGSFVTKTRFLNKNHNREVWLYTLVGGKHDWPGAWGNMDFSASDEIWSFFSKYIKQE